MVVRGLVLSFGLTTSGFITSCLYSVSSGCGFEAIVSEGSATEPKFSDFNSIFFLILPVKKQHRCFSE